MTKVSRTALILSTRGPLDAYRVKVGDFVLCGDGAFRKVSSSEKSMDKAYELKGHGHPSLILADGQRIFSTTYKRKGAERLFSPFTFSSPGEMKGRFWASPRKFPESNPGLSYSEAWLAGLLLSAGSFGSREPLRLSVHESKRIRLQGELAALKLKYTFDSLHTQFFYDIAAPKLKRWMSKNVNQTMGRKAVPLSILGAPKHIRKSFYDGVMFGRGVEEEGSRRLSSDNRMEAVTLKLLAQSLSYSTALYLKETRGEEGVKEYWQIVAEENARSSVEIGRNRCGLVRESEEGRKKYPLMVIQIEGGHSIVVDGLIFE